MLSIVIVDLRGAEFTAALALASSLLPETDSGVCPDMVKSNEYTDGFKSYTKPSNEAKILEVVTSLLFNLTEPVFPEILPFGDGIFLILNCLDELILEPSSKVAVAVILVVVPVEGTTKYFPSPTFLIPDPDTLTLLFGTPEIETVKGFSRPL